MIVEKRTAMLLAHSNLLISRLSDVRDRKCQYLLSIIVARAWCSDLVCESLRRALTERCHAALDVSKRAQNCKLSKLPLAALRVSGAELQR
jgi:hypothetical protein